MEKERILKLADQGERLTQSRKLSLLKKQEFVDRINYAISGQPRRAVTNVKLDIWYNEFGYSEETMVVTFEGGACGVRNCRYNSNSANLRAIADMVDGDCYDELQRYEEMRPKGYSLEDVEVE